MNELHVFDYNGIEVVDSRDVAAMVEREHRELLKSIRTYANYLAEGEIPLNGFFIESSYIDSIGRTLPCYFVTKKGCDMIANKMTGKKGVLFTAAYVTAFEKMREQLLRIPGAAPAVSPGGLARLISTTRRVMLDMGCSAHDIGRMTQGMFRTWAVPIPEGLARQIPGQLSIWSRPYPGELQSPAIPN